MKGEKFLELAKFFQSSKDSQIILSFENIEKMIGEKLCKSAYTYNAYWQYSKTHTITFSWINSGYKLDGVDLVNQRISFIKL